MFDIILVDDSDGADFAPCCSSAITSSHLKDILIKEKVVL